MGRRGNELQSGDCVDQPGAHYGPIVQRRAQPKRYGAIQGRWPELFAQQVGFDKDCHDDMVDINR
jgi:hypothetical protein